MNYDYKNITQLEGLISNTYILAIISALVFVGIAILISSMVAYQGGKNPTDAKTRRIWFWIIGIVATTAFFCYNYFYVSSTIVPTQMLQDKFFTHTAIATGAVFVVYIIAGFAMSKLLKKAKFGTVFPSKAR